MTIRAPRNVGLRDLAPYPYTVLWSHGITPAQVAQFRRLNPKREAPDELEAASAVARTYWFDRYCWIVFYTRPTWGTVIHEATHAVGACFRYIEATREVELGGEIEAYLLGDLAGRIGADVRARPGP